MLRSLITLKALTFSPTGAIAASPYNLTSRAAWRCAQLGLPLLLGTRRHSHAECAAQRRICRRGASVARMAVCARSPAVLLN